MSTIFCGINWAEEHHDIALVDQDGTQVAKLRISDDSAGFHALMELLVRHGDSAEAPIPVAIETSARPACRQLASHRPQDLRNQSPCRRPLPRPPKRLPAKSDAADARVLANILRTDQHAHRPLPADSEAGQAVAVLTRAHQDAIRDRQQMINRLHSHLREYYPAALTALAGPGSTRPAPV